MSQTKEEEKKDFHFEEVGTIEQFDKLNEENKKNYFKEFRRNLARMEIMEEQVGASESFARQQTTENAELRNRLAQVIDMVEGHFNKAISSMDNSLRICVEAWDAHRSLVGRVKYLERKRNWWPWIFGGIAALVVAMVLGNPQYAIPLGGWLQTPVGSLVLVLSFVLAIAVIFLYRKKIG